MRRVQQRLPRQARRSSAVKNVYRSLCTSVVRLSAAPPPPPPPPPAPPTRHIVPSVVPVMPVGPPAPNATPKAPKSPPEAPKAAPEAPQSPPEAPKSPPEAPKAAPEAPKSPPEAPKSPPEAPKAAPKAPKAAPEAPRSPPEAPRSPPEAPKAAPKAPKAAPEAPKSPPEAPKSPPEAPKAAPKAPKAAPEAPRSPPEAPRSPPEAPKAAPKAPKAAPEAPKSPPEAPKAATEAPKSPPEAPKAAPEAPRSPPEAPKAAPKAPKSPPEAPKAAPKAPKAAPEAPRSPPEAPRSPPEAPKAAPKAPKAAPEAPKSPPEAPKAATEAPRSPPEAPKAAPKAPKAAPEAPKSPPEAPRSPPEAPKSPPEAPKAAPEAPRSPPEAPRSPPEAPKSPPEAPKAAPEAPRSPPEAPKAAPEAPKSPPEAPKAATEAPRSPPEAPKAAPKAPKAAPEAPKSPPEAPRSPPEAPKSPPEAPKAAPEAPRSPPEAPRSPPEAPKAAPKAPKAAPEAPKAASTSAPRAHHANGKPSQMSHKPTDKSASPLSRTVVATGRLGQSLGHGKAAAPPPSPTPPPPPPPPPQPQAPTSTAATPPASLVVASLHVSIAPPEKTEADGSMNSIKADASEQELFEALRPSLSTRVEEAVRHGKATHPLRAVRTGASHAETAETAAAATPPPPLDESPGDWSSARREGKLQPLPMTIASSLNRHEIPSDLGGAESTTADAASSPTEDSIEHDSNLSARPNATEVHETPVVERLPGEVWRGVMTRAANTAPASESIDEQDSENCITVSVAGSSVMPGRGLTVQLRKSFFGAMVALQAVSRALDAVEARCGEMIANGSDNGNSSGASGTTPPSPVTVTWCTLPHCTFFGSVQSPAEFSLKQRVAYVEAKEAVMQKFHQLVHCMKGKAHFVALASCAAGPVLDLGAEIFFACPERYLLPARASTITEFRSGRATAVPAMSVGFPLTRVGFYPSTCTVAALQRICGSQSTIKWVPILHSYDASSLEGVGLLRLGEPSPSSSVEADVVSHAAGTFRWSLWCERVLLRYLCRTPMQRQWVMEKLLWSNDFQRKVRPSPAAVSGVDARFMETTWYTYAMSVLCRSETAQAESEKVFHEGNSKKDAAGDVDGSAALVRACVAAPPCRGAAHAVQVRLRSLRHVLPLLPHRRFLAFPYHQTSSWAAKMQALTAASESPGAAVLLDCSDKAVAATVKLVETQLVASAAQRGRLPYLNVILIGEDAAVRAVLALLPCAAVVSSTSAFHEQGHASVQQVRLFAAPQWPVDLQQDTLVAALAYLQRKETPHVVAAGPAPQRLLLALCREALVMAQSLPDASRIESAAQEHLGLRLGPFALIDAYGAATLASMAAAATAEEAAQTKAAATAPHSVSPNALLESCTRAMAREGLLGVRSARGGFYGAATAVAGNGGGAARVLRDAVVDTYVRHHASPAEMADRLRAAVLNAACELLVRGEVPGVEDVDLLSLSTLGWREETGGVLYQVDQCGAEGLPRLVQLMLCLSSTGVAPHLAPHPLLSAMAAQQLRFANLRSSGLLPS